MNPNEVAEILQETVITDNENNNHLDISNPKKEYNHNNGYKKEFFIKQFAEVEQNYDAESYDYDVVENHQTTLSGRASFRFGFQQCNLFTQ
jgi:hypothetical protein